MTAFIPLLLWVAQLTLGTQCGCATEPIVERTTQGTWVGAIAADTEVSVGWYIAANGDITFEDR